LIKHAAAVTKHRQLGENSAGGVGCALLSARGEIFTGVCIDTACSMGFCAEHNAIGSMITAGESRIVMIVAVSKDKKGKIRILKPCGRCREFMRQVNMDNMETKVVIGKNKTVRLKSLLPY
jgi:cytidine deaminase